MHYFPPLLHETLVSVFIKKSMGGIYTFRFWSQPREQCLFDNIQATTLCGRVFVCLYTSPACCPISINFYLMSSEILSSLEIL